ncbi:MAG: SDR family NAD(P)-dependent oxidoreductase [Pirellulales bacterium]
MDVSEKAAVITGGSRGVGRATAICLSRLGCSVLINYRSSKEAALKVVKQIEEQGGRATCFAGDVADDSACKAMMEAAVSQFGRLDILVNNAGTTQFIEHGDLDSVTDEVWDSIFAVNLKGPFQCMRAAAPYLRKSNSAEIVNVASIAGMTTVGSCIPYGASKAALINLTINMARVFGPTVRVNAVAPGFIAGEWLKEGLGENYEAIEKSVAEKTALGQVNTPEDIAAAIVSLITGSDTVTGQTLVVDAGQSIGPSAASIATKFD